MLKIQPSASLRYIAMDKNMAAYVAHALVAEGRSFYCEPWPNERVRVYVDDEHAGRVCQLALLDHRTAIKRVAP